MADVTDHGKGPIEMQELNIIDQASEYKVFIKKITK